MSNYDLFGKDDFWNLWGYNPLEDESTLHESDVVKAEKAAIYYGLTARGAEYRAKQDKDGVDMSSMVESVQEKRKEAIATFTAIGVPLAVGILLLNK